LKIFSCIVEKNQNYLNIKSIRISSFAPFRQLADVNKINLLPLWLGANKLILLIIIIHKI